MLLAAEDLESIEATLELLSDPAAQERIRRSQDEVERGELLDEDEVRALVAKRRMPEGELPRRCHSDGRTTAC